MNTEQQYRLDFDALENWYGRLPVRVLAEHLGVSRGTIDRYRAEGIPHDRADDAAIALGGHPADIWPYFDETESWWFTPRWLRRRRTAAVLDSWRLRLDCTGIAGGHARRMFNIDEEGAA